MERQIQQHIEGIKTVAVGLGGGGTSLVLQDVNLVISALVGLATLAYICVKILKELRKE